MLKYCITFRFIHIGIGHFVFNMIMQVIRILFKYSKHYYKQTVLHIVEVNKCYVVILPISTLVRQIICINRAVMCNCLKMSQIVSNLIVGRSNSFFYKYMSQEDLFRINKHKTFVKQFCSAT